MDKTELNLEKWCSGAGIQFVDAAAEANYKARTRRIADAILLKKPDRVPVLPSWSMFPAYDSGLSYEEVHFESQKAFPIWEKAVLEFEPDVADGFFPIAPALEALGYKALRFPGHGIPANTNYQFVEAEYVTAEDFYDHYLDDPTGFVLHKMLPQVCKNLEPFQSLPTLNIWFSYFMGIGTQVSQFGVPEIIEALESLIKAGRIALESFQMVIPYILEITSLGYPMMSGGFSAAPFDVIGDYIRGTRGIMLDMHRRPEKLLAAIDKLTPYMIELGRSGAAVGPFVAMPLHKHDANFLSPEQFSTFYWPSLKKVFLALIEDGLIPYPIWEGENTPRLAEISDIPAGKALYWFQNVDIQKAQQYLGNKVCFAGNLPSSLLFAGSPEKIKDYIRELIDVFGKDGGLIVSPGTVVDEAQHENIKTMIDFTKEYGKD